MTLAVLYIGNVGPRSHATYCTENHVSASLIALGHTVHPVMEGPTCHVEARRVLASTRVDLVLYTRTEGLRWPHADALALWSDCADRGIPTASLHLDQFWGLARRDVKVTTGNALFAVDHAFTADGDHDDDFAAAGITHHWLPPGVLYEECRIGIPRAEYDGDCGWVGSSRGYHAEWKRRPQLVDALVAKYGNRLTRAGDGVTVREQALNDLYASVPVVAGDSLAPLHERSKYASDRITETPGRGGVLVHPPMDWWQGALGDAVVWCDDWSIEAELDKIEEVRAWTPERRAAHRLLAVDTIKGAHTYRHRARTVLDTIGL